MGGEAKRRGTYEQRVAQAKARKAALLEQQNLALTKPLPSQPKVAVLGSGGNRRSLIALAATLAALDMHQR
jgi:hypothetical protein